MTTSDLPELVRRSQATMAHAWMVRTFVKHSPEAEDFPDLMHVARTVFDVSRALETRVSDPPGYFRMLGKKLHRLRQAADQFAVDAPVASTHTNFAQAVISIQEAVAELESLLAAAMRAGADARPTGSPDEELPPASGSDGKEGSANTSLANDTET